MQLSERLQSVANLVKEKGSVADIGCDHGYTSIFLVLERNVDHVIAMDINKDPLAKAKANIKANRLQDKIETRLSDGARELNVGEVNTILISGMGGALMIKILSERMDVMKECGELVLQPQSEIHLVRRFLHANGFRIDEEIFLKEDGKYYVAFRAVCGQETYQRDIFYYYGKYLLEERNMSLFEFLNREKKMVTSIYESLVSVDTVNSQKRKNELRLQLALIEEAMTYYL